MPLINNNTNESYEINNFMIDPEVQECGIVYTAITLNNGRMKAQTKGYKLDNKNEKIIDPTFQPVEGVSFDPQNPDTWGDYVPSQFPLITDESKQQYELIKNYITNDGESGYVAIKNMLYSILQEVGELPTGEEWELV
jgi:hypothetical protein